VRPPLSLAVLVAVLACTPAAAAAPADSSAARVRSAIFYYPWYGNPSHDGAYEHWQQNGGRPPQRIASAYFPARGVYSSADRAVVAAQMREIAATGVDQVVVSWWGRGSLEDARLGLTVASARAAGLSVAVHVEPYAGRSPGSVEADVAYLRPLGVTDVYVYRADDFPAADWAPVNDRLTAPLRVFAQTGRVGQAAAGHFDGVYTYDILVYGGSALARRCSQAHAAGLLCAPSVGPGYDARRAAGDARIKARRDGATYDSMWRAALAAGADLVTITSYNEWHEGTQIEPARARTGYRSYDGAWGRFGKLAETAYVDRTADWVTRLEQRAG
jgi:glycoprotein endo-alpha-1,2-mannosidase